MPSVASPDLEVQALEGMGLPTCEGVGIEAGVGKVHVQA
jgi:hypothetical protein